MPSMSRTKVYKYYEKTVDAENIFNIYKLLTEFKNEKS